MYPKSSWSSWKKSWFYMTVTKEDGLYFASKTASENLHWWSTEKKEGWVGRVVDAIQDFSAKGLTDCHVVRTFPYAGLVS